MAVPGGSRVPIAGSAVAVAVCAAFTTTSAGATEVILPIDVLLTNGYNLDFNGDSTAEFQFTRFLGTPPSFENSIAPLQSSGGIIATSESTPKSGTYATLLGSGEVIDGSRSYMTNTSAFLSGFTTDVPGGAPFGHFFDQSGFVGLTFQLSGATHYGWVEIHDNDGNLTLVPRGLRDRSARSDHDAEPRSRARLARTARRRRGRRAGAAPAQEGSVITAALRALPSVRRRCASGARRPVAPG